MCGVWKMVHPRPREARGGVARHDLRSSRSFLLWSEASKAAQSSRCGAGRLGAVHSPNQRRVCVQDRRPRSLLSRKAGRMYSTHLISSLSAPSLVIEGSAKVGMQGEGVGEGEEGGGGEDARWTGLQEQGAGDQAGRCSWVLERWLLAPSRMMGPRCWRRARPRSYRAISDRLGLDWQEERGR